MKTFTAIVAAASLSVALSISLFSQDIRLEYKFKLGEIDRYKESTSSSMTGEGLPGGTRKSVTEMFVSQMTDKINPDGSAEIIRTIDSATTTLDEKPIPNPPQTKALIGLPMKVILTKYGKVLDVSAGKDITDELTKQIVEGSRKQLLASSGFPSKALKLKESWKDSAKVSMETQNGLMTTELKTTTSLIGFDKVLGYDVAVLKVAMEITGELGAGMGYIKGTGRGNTFFSDITGKEIRRFIDMDQTVDMNTPQGSMTLTIKASQKKELIK
jgi:hypothetical protein